MLRVKCINPNCTAPEGKFFWDDRSRAEGGPAQPGDPGALAFIAECPFCGAENKIWLFRVRMEDEVRREAGGQ